MCLVLVFGTSAYTEMPEVEVDLFVCLAYQARHLPKMYIYKYTWYMSSMVASVGEPDRDLAATQFTKNCVAYNIIEHIINLKLYNVL